MYKNMKFRPVGLIAAIVAATSLVTTSPTAARAEIAATTDPRTVAAASFSGVYVSVTNTERVAAGICGWGSGTIYVTAYRSGRTFMNARPFWMNFGSGGCSSVGDLADGQALPYTTYYVKASTVPYSTACGTSTTSCGSVTTGSLLRLPWNAGEKKWVTCDGLCHDRNDKQSIARYAIDFGSTGNVLFAVLAARGGTVVKKGWESCSGNVVHIQHNDGTKAVYVHLSSFANLTVGQSVVRGQRLGVDGKTGTCASANHLHFALIDRNGNEMAAIWEGINRQARTGEELTSSNVAQ